MKRVGKYRVKKAQLLNVADMYKHGVLVTNKSMLCVRSICGVMQLMLGKRAAEIKDGVRGENECGLEHLQHVLGISLIIQSIRALLQ